jgi:hypothetical protein
MSKEPKEASRLICMPVALWLLVQAKEKFQDSAAYGVAFAGACPDMGIGHANFLTSAGGSGA